MATTGDTLGAAITVAVVALVLVTDRLSRPRRRKTDRPLGTVAWLRRNVGGE